MIDIDSLNVDFDGVKVVDNVNLNIEDGQSVVIIGESGSGKSMLISAILRILPPEAMVSGSIKYNGTELLTLSEKELQKLRGKELAYIPQGSSNSLNPLLKVGFQVGEPLIEHKGYTKKKAVEVAVEWMKKLGLGREKELADSYPHTLSGGMKQRVLIAMGAAAGANTLFADEPTKGLDSERIQRVIELFGQLEDKTLLCVSHDLHFAESVADYICVMYSAQQIEYCSKEDFFREPLHPYSRMLINALAENGLQADMKFAPPSTIQSESRCRFCDRCPYCEEICKTKVPDWYSVGNRKVRCHRYASQS